MPPSFASLWPDVHGDERLLARIDRRRRPERRLLGRLALALQHEDGVLVDWLMADALAWPEIGQRQCRRKAGLLFAMTTLLAQARCTDRALQVAPLIPFAPGMTQVLIFSTDRPHQRYCWRVTPAYALVRNRTPHYFPVQALIQTYRQGRVSIDQDYLQRVLLPRQTEPPPILLLP